MRRDDGISGAERRKQSAMSDGEGALCLMLCRARSEERLQILRETVGAQSAEGKGGGGRMDVECSAAVSSTMDGEARLEWSGPLETWAVGGLGAREEGTKVAGLPGGSAMRRDGAGPGTGMRGQSAMRGDDDAVVLMP
jgi:hypothetical protein